MSFHHPLLLIVAVLLTVAAVAGYVVLHRRRMAAFTAAGFGGRTGGGIRRHLPYALMVAGLLILLTGVARPEAKISVPRVSGTVVLAFDVSNSMSAADVNPSRLAAAKTAAIDFVDKQPDSVDVGVLLFGDQALMTQAPTGDHGLAAAAINRLSPGGGTSLGQAILVALGTITGKPVGLPTDGATPTTQDLGYWPSATIVVFSDGQQTGGPDAEAAAEVSAAAGVRIQTVGVGTTKGATVEVDGYQLSTALDESLLTTVAQTTGGAYHRAGDEATLADTTDAIDLRLTTEKKPVELTGPFAGAALLLLALGALLSTRWHGRIV
ncbi:VWA domain-containing protein [Actinoplanes sp. N902-109]|uniref:VWA domain-containing protein n=1 Tax=Actinoplanes sp. (strain N902-109) TaxID=649831 RepID=UPI0003293B9B|nr:VWA domain-containing protein [Actinoplanes sp. N902-109]AGL13778.1 hypothetical protein L083_0268 [Actinoplanes sp. N902-109]